MPFFFSLLYVRTSCVSRHPVSYIVSACLVSYCLLVRQQQRFHHPTLRTTSVVLVGCTRYQKKEHHQHDHCCILVHVRKKSYIVSAYLVSYYLLLRQQQRFEHPTLKQTSVFLGCIQNSTISSKRVRCCTNKHTNRGHNLHGRVSIVKKQKGKH